MEDLILRLLAHNADSRGIDRVGLENDGLRAGTTPGSVAEEASRLLCTIAGSPDRSVARELAEVYSYRLIFLLLPEKCLFGDPERDKPLISAHLVSLGIQPTEEIVRGLKFFVENFRAKTRSDGSKKSITDVYVRHPRVYDEILGRQHGRCATCGIVLEYGRNMTLDHVLPWHLGDDPPDGSNWQFLCDRCNRGKGIYPYYSLSPVGSNWIRPVFEHGLADDVRYAVLRRDRRCTVTGDEPWQAELAVTKRIESGCWVLDNLKVVRIDLVS